MKDEIPAALQLAEEYRELFGKDNFFLEIQNHHQAFDPKVQKALVELSAQTGIPLVATNDVKYLKKEEAAFHEVLLCLGKGEVMSDPTKRELRQEKRELKRAGVKHRRRTLKRGLADNPEDAPFDEAGFGRYRTSTLNGIDRDGTRNRPDGPEDGR